MNYQIVTITNYILLCDFFSMFGTYNPIAFIVHIFFFKMDYQ